MRRDHRPYWLKRLQDRYYHFLVSHFLAPQLDVVGNDFEVWHPRYLEISGPNIKIGNHVHVMALRDSPVRLSVFGGEGAITIGDYCILNPGSRITSAERIEVGKGCMLAMNAYVTDADWHGVEHRAFSPGVTRPTRLADNVWIGDSAFVGKGVTVGENAIVGAYAVVTKDVPANTIVAGNPAREIGTVDADNIVGREFMFTGNVSFGDYLESVSKQALNSNRLTGYLSALLAPGKKD